MGEDRAERKPPGGGGQRASGRARPERQRGTCPDGREAGGVGEGTNKRGRRVNTGPAKSLLFLLFHVKLYFT